MPQTNPTILTASVACAESIWTFGVEANAWTGNGAFALSDDGSYIEEHDLPSTSAAADGTSDTLEQTLSVVATRSEATRNSSTAFPCNSPDLQGSIIVYARGGSTLADCIAFGANPQVWAEWLPEYGCDAVLTEADDTATAD